MCKCYARAKGGGARSISTTQVRFQASLLRAQLQAEDNACAAASFDPTPSIVLCDSGAPSGGAYCSDDFTPRGQLAALRVGMDSGSATPNDAAGITARLRAHRGNGASAGSVAYDRATG